MDKTGLKIAFAGAGAVGCHYGSKLILAGFDVQLLARGEHLAALQQHGLRHESAGQCRQVPVHACDEPATLAAADIVIISCKMTTLDAMIASIHPHLRSDVLLVTLQNGVTAPSRVTRGFPEHAVVAGTAFIGARLEHPGHLIHSAAGGLRFGLWQNGAGADRLQQLIDAFNVASVPVRLDDDPQAMLWRKLLWNCGFNAITAVTRRFARNMASNPETLVIVRKLMEETVAVANAQGVAIGAADIDKHIEITLAMGPVKTSMWQDLEAGRRSEIDDINGYVVRAGEALNIDTPANRFLTALIHALEHSG